MTNTTECPKWMTASENEQMFLTEQIPVKNCKVPLPKFSLELEHHIVKNKKNPT